jgi:hypothetical protein
MIKKGDKVIYSGKEYVCLHSYSSGYCELKSIERSKIELVHISEIKLSNIENNKAKKL